MFTEALMVHISSYMISVEYGECEHKLTLQFELCNLMQVGGWQGAGEGC
jgi:hypothetical protein